MNTILDSMKSRRSIRKYKSDMVPMDLIKKVVEAGLYAASGKGKQSQVIITVTNQELREKIVKLNASIHNTPDFDTFYGAPVIMIVAASKKANEATVTYDGSLSIGNMMLEAHELGLGSCWIHRAKQSMEHDLYKEIFKSVGLDATDFEGVGHVAIGYIDGDEPKCPPRRENRDFYIL